mmetsp:Transcript_30261/g.67804  ORF Transcript_30261/g.67804 Transcript_30261/m.67804 type:complete len:162 (-) Transcript_30261:137-622(-)
MFLNVCQPRIVPDELREASAVADGGASVDVKLDDKSGEDYRAPPPPAYTAYSGGGQTAGAAEVQAGAVVDGSTGAGQEAPVVDEGKPKTVVMVRLASGKRLKAQLNADHTVAHLHALIRAEGAGDLAYVLIAGYPPAQITDATLTIQAAGLAGAQVTQKRV